MTRALTYNPLLYLGFQEQEVLETSADDQVHLLILDQIWRGIDSVANRQVQEEQCWEVSCDKRRYLAKEP
jgi:hypothetical protein